MIKLALIGKNIQHSRSPEIYRNLLKCEIQYDLLDYETPSLIPSVSELLKIYDGISITSPYKKHFLNQVRLVDSAKDLGALNCLRKDIGGFSGENTDYLAIIDILQKLKTKYRSLSIIILGDGVMSTVVQFALKQLDIEFKLLSRKLTDDFKQLNITEAFDKAFTCQNQKLVINTCSREFIFNGHIDKNTIFWDFNYDFTPHSNFLASKVQQYFDGMEMLQLQAVYALAFWSIKIP